MACEPIVRGGPNASFTRVFGRRSLLAAGAVAALSGSVVAACGPARHTARPTGVSGVIQISYQFHWTVSVPWTPAAKSLVNAFVQANFNSRHRGLRAVLYQPGDPGGGWAVTSATMGAMLAGNDPDIFCACCANLAPFVVYNLMLPLDTYLQRDNVDPSIWSAGHIRGLTWSNAVMALPAYNGPQVMGYRQDLLDDLGLGYPEPQWTYSDAAGLWAACSRQIGEKQQYGAALQWYDGWDYLLHGFGGAYLSTDRRTCLIDRPGAIAAGEWFCEQLAHKVITYRNDVSGLVDGTEVFSVLGGWDVFQEATRLGAVKWDLVPLPQWPHGPFTFANNDFLGISSQSKHPDQAWELLHWLAVEPDFQRFLIRSTLVTPGLNALWEEWVALIQAAAPPLRTKQLQYYGDAARAGIGLPSNYTLSADAGRDGDQWMVGEDRGRQGLRCGWLPAGRADGERHAGDGHAVDAPRGRRAQGLSGAGARDRTGHSGHLTPTGERPKRWSGTWVGAARPRSCVRQSCRPAPA